MPKGIKGFQAGHKQFGGFENKFKKGDVSAFKGHTHSVGNRRKTSERMKGNIVSQETRKKISLANKGKKKPPLSEEHKKKISISLTGKRQSQESIEKRIAPLRGRKRPPRSKEWSEKIGLANKGKHTTMETRNKQSLKNKEIFKKYMGENHWNYTGGTILQRQEKIAGRKKPINCELCGKTNRKICFDHDHNTNKFRGWICHRCNVALGMINDDIQTLQLMIRYLEINK